VEANSTGGQGSRRAVVSSGGGGDDDDVWSSLRRSLRSSLSLKFLYKRAFFSICSG
jgi:hypothetical protein